MLSGGPPLRIETLPVFEPLLHPKRYKGAFGGRGSGKSHFFADTIVDLHITNPGTRGVCIREVQQSLQLSSKQLILDKIRKHGVGPWFDEQKAIIKAPGDGLILFQGMQDHTADSIKSLERFDYAWVEEAQSLSERSLDLLRPTLRHPRGSELMFSWNPENGPDHPAGQDPVDKLFRGENALGPKRATLVEAHYWHNKWMPQELIDEMEFDKRRDPDKYRWIWLGQYKRLSEAAVYRNWSVKEFETPSDVRFFFGADWGYAVDPTCLIRAFIVDRTIYVDTEAYAVGCEIDYTPALFAGNDTEDPPRWRNPRGYKGIPGAMRWPIRADSARPETISYMKRRGFNVKPSVKGAGSVEDGIEFLKSYEIVVHPRCKHTIDELTMYSWKVEKKTGDILPILADKHNHVMDALRYALEGLIRRGGSLVDVLD